MSRYFSIVTVTLNSEQTIERCLESLERQGRAKFELIVKDGGSKDRTVELIRKITNIRSYECTIIEGKDRGIYNALNIAIKQATGDWILILHSDDILEDMTLEYLLNLMPDGEDDRGIIAYGMCKHIDQHGRDQGVFRYSHLYLRSKLFMTLEHPATVISRKAYSILGGYSERFEIASDYEFFVRAIQSDILFIPVDRILAMHGVGGISQRQRLKALKECLQIKRKHGIIQRYELWLGMMYVYARDIIRTAKVAIFMTK